MRSNDSKSARENLPVILGAGLTGLAISRALSSQGVRHVLVGDPPGDAPRLGESLNAEGSLEAARQFPDLARYFSSKRRQVLFFGDHALSFESAQRSASPAYYRMLAYPSTVRLLHVDRVGFDRGLFEAAVANELCIHVEGRAAALDYSAATDRICGISLTSGVTIGSTYVFDATNHLCFVARKVGVRRRALDTPRRVVFAHYRSAGHSAVERLPWLDATSLMRLDAGADSVDGLAWCIPLGDYVSVGISVDPARTSASATLLLDWLDRAWSRRGLDVRAAFPRRGAPVDLPTEHYHHERCSGRNWLLAGASCCQFWFPSSTGIATGLVAARLAADALKAPRTIGRLYQDYLDDVASSHPGLSWLVRDDPATVTLDDLRRRAEMITGGNARRLSEYLGLHRTPSELAFGAGLLPLFEAERRQATPVRIVSAPAPAQRARLFDACGDSWLGRPVEVAIVSAPANLQGPPAILGLIDTLSGQCSVESSAELVTPEVTLHIDQFRLAGVDQWVAWVTWLRATRRVRALELVPGSLSCSGTEWRLTAQWRGSIGTVASVSPPFEMAFAMAEDRVSAVHTRRADHTFVLGDAILPAVAFAAMLGERPAAIQPSPV